MVVGVPRKGQVLTYRPTPFGGQIEGLSRYVSEELERLSAELINLEAAIGRLERLAVVNGVELLYLWSDSQDTTVDPGPGNVRGNALLLGNATELSFSWIDRYGREVINNSLLKVGDLITVNAADFSGNVVFAATTPSFVENGWSRVGVSNTGGGPGFNPATGEGIRVEWRPDSVLGPLDR